VVHDGWSDGRYAAEVEPWSQDADTLSMMATGDRITLTTAKRALPVYRVTRRKMVDPHLAESDVPALGGDAALVTCPSQDSASTLQLVIQAITSELPAAEPKEEQKL
jgi:sortase (surface protein transpeptidase)